MKKTSLTAAMLFASAAFASAANAGVDPLTEVKPMDSEWT